jgi:UDP-glucose 4-epimerase
MSVNTQQSRAIVTGGAGFIGSHIADELARRGWRVTILDNLFSGKLENIRHLISAGRAEFIQGSVTDQPLLRDIFSGAQYVFHQAAIASVPASIADPAASHEVNVTGTLCVLLAARDCGVKKVVFASSAAVYGDTPTFPKQEDLPLAPLSPYAVEKLTAEYYCRVFNTVYGLPTACLRYFNVFGPRQDPASEYAAVIPKFILSILQGRAPTIFGDGEQTRDFAFVGDVVAANLLAAESPTTGVFNIGSGERISLNRLTRLLLQLLGRQDLQPVYQPERTGDVKHSLADISRARAFGYTPSYTLEKGLQETIPSFLSPAPVQPV